MTLYLRTVTGAMLDVTRCPILEVTVADDAMFEVIARTDLEDDALRFVLYRDRSKGTATSFLNQIAARNPKAKGLAPESFYDDRFVKELDASGFYKQLWGK